jgi:hypothetical protein
VYSGLRAGEEIKTGRLLCSLRLYEITFEIAEQAGMLQRYWRQQGRTLSLPDVPIAAVALGYKMTLLTANLRDFPMPDLLLYQFPEEPRI